MTQLSHKKTQSQPNENNTAADRHTSLIRSWRQATL